MFNCKFVQLHKYIATTCILQGVNSYCDRVQSQSDTINIRMFCQTGDCETALWVRIDLSPNGEYNILCIAIHSQIHSANCNNCMWLYIPAWIVYWYCHVASSLASSYIQYYCFNHLNLVTLIYHTRWPCILIAGFSGYINIIQQYMIKHEPLLIVYEILKSTWFLISKWFSSPRNQLIL